MYDYEKGSEKELIRRAKKGDVKAFSQLYARIYKELYRFSLCLLKHPQDAEDAVSETVLSAFENISGLKKDNSFKNWIFTILNNRCRKMLRSRQTEQKKEKSEQKDGAGENAHRQDYADQYVVREAFAALDDEERLIVAFSVFGGYKSSEIAAFLDANPATVRSRKSRALEKMRRILEPEARQGING